MSEYEEPILTPVVGQVSGLRRQRLARVPGEAVVCRKDFMFKSQLCSLPAEHLGKFSVSYFFKEGRIIAGYRIYDVWR